MKKLSEMCDFHDDASCFNPDDSEVLPHNTPTTDDNGSDEELWEFWKLIALANTKIGR